MDAWDPLTYNPSSRTILASLRRQRARPLLGDVNAVTLLTPSERRILEGIRDTGTAGEICDAWAIDKGWAAHSAGGRGS